MTSQWASSIRRLTACALGRFVLVFWALLGGGIDSPVQTLRADFTVNYSTHVDPVSLQAFDVAILSPDVDLDLRQLRRVSGQWLLGYVSVVEVAAQASYQQALRDLGIPVLETNHLWRSQVMDVSRAAWSDFVVTNLARRVADRGFDGFFLDTPDSVELLKARFPGRAAEFHAGLAGLIRSLRQTYPGKPIVMNRGFQVWGEVQGHVDGILIESMFRTADADGRNARPVPEAASQQLLQLARPIRAAGKRVFVLDYADPSDVPVAAATARRIEREGFEGLVSTPDLRGHVLAPLREVRRRVLVVYGRDSENLDELVRWPADSHTGIVAQMPLQWLGYELDYYHVRHDLLPSTLPSDCAGIMLDRYLTIPLDREPELADWLVRQLKEGSRLVFLGELPFRVPHARRRIIQQLNLGGSVDSIPGIGAVAPRLVSDKYQFETSLIVRSNEFVDVRAPTSSEILLSLAGRHPKDGQERVFDAAFVAPWGGAAWDPYSTFIDASHDPYWLIDPFHFFASAFGQSGWPAPDMCTREGVRLFFSHLDGDGFRHASSVDRNRRSGQIIMDRVLRKYPFPFTCSIIEAEIRALVRGQVPEEEAELTRLAREMFSLPNVEAASHTYSHPFFWVAQDRTVKLYESAGLVLKEDGSSYQFDLRREIEGSVEYIDRELLPAGKRTQMFLWSGNCRPPPEALEMTRALGLENMNGGDTITSRKHPSVARVAAASMPAGKELQIHCGYQNETYYWIRKPLNASLTLPFFGGLVHALDGFEMLETPRRLKPVNIYYHFYSGDNMSALRAVLRLYDWALKQELHAVYASEYARMVRDSRATRIYQRQEGEWWIVNGGRQRSFRFVLGEGRPDMLKSRGVTGYRVDRDGLRVHTDGSPRIRLVLAKPTGRHFHLERSTMPLRWERLEAAQAEFEVMDLRAGRVVLGGAEPGRRYRVVENEAARVVESDAEGYLSLDLAAQARVRVEAEKGVLP